MRVTNSEKSYTQKKSSKRAKKKERMIRKMKAVTSRSHHVTKMYLMTTRTPSFIAIRRQILLWIEMGREFPH